MIELELNKIKIDENRNEQLIIFREKGGTRYLPLMIGVSEVHAIKMKLSGVVPPRPLTHDLMLTVIENLGAKLESVAIDRLSQNTFYAKLHLRIKSQKTIEIDARPSDSVALAVRSNVPIYVSEEVLGQAGVTNL